MIVRKRVSLSARSRWVYGLICIAIGCYPIAVVLGLVPMEASASNAPPWVIACAGLVFVIAGFMILLAHNPMANDMLAGFLLMLFGAIGTWASLFSPGEGISGGLPFLSREANVLFGRWVFGLGALICFALSTWAFRRAAAKRK